MKNEVPISLAKSVFAVGTISGCKWRQVCRMFGKYQVTCHNPDAIKGYQNSADCCFHGNMLADSCDYFEQTNSQQKEKSKHE